MWYIIALIVFLCLLSGLIYFVRREAKQSARLDAIKREIKERQRAQNIIDNVRRESADSVRNKLQQTK